MATNTSHSRSTDVGPSNIALGTQGVILLLSGGLSGVIMSVVATGDISRVFAANYLLASLLPVVSVPLAMFGPIPQFDLWVWYFLVFGWLGSASYYGSVIQQVVGTLTKADLWKSSLSTGFTLLWLVVSAPTAYVVGWMRGYALEQTVGLMYLIMNPVAFPVAVLTDVSAFTHAPEIWVLILLLWVGWWKGIKLLGSLFEEL